MDDFGSVNRNQNSLFTPTNAPRTESGGGNKLLHVPVNQQLTLYLSTIGSLTGPSLDLVKFGKLSRWAINGKPLTNKKQKTKHVHHKSQESAAKMSM